MVGDGIGNVVA